VYYRSVTYPEGKILDKSPGAFRTISEVSAEIDVPKHVLRFWESKFSQIKPMKLGGGRRYYRPPDLDLLRGIRGLLYDQGYTIKGVQRILRQNGVKFVKDPSLWAETGTERPKPQVIPDVAADAAAGRNKQLDGKAGAVAAGGHDPRRHSALNKVLKELQACRSQLAEIYGTTAVV
jgi:DNA-binding transcriptional MerR regulator